MFNLIRRISGSVIPRPDRPWEEDPTSNAPQTGRKRRLSSTEREQDDGDQERTIKKNRRVRLAEAVAEVDEPTRESSPAPVPQGKDVDTEDVREVTKGVQEVELVDNAGKAPESVPLPEEEIGELNESAAVVTPPPETQEDKQTEGSSTQEVSDPVEAERDEDASSRESSPSPPAVASEEKEEGENAESTPADQPDSARDTAAAFVETESPMKRRTRRSKKLEESSPTKA